MLTITHLQVDHIPDGRDGWTQLFFFTQKDGEYFWGTDNNPIDPSDLERWVHEKKVLKLCTPIIINDNQSLFIGYKSDPIVYKGFMRGQSLEQIGKLSELVE